MLGACVSPDPTDNEDAKMWFNCVEEMVFTDDDFCRDIDPPAVVDVESPVSTPDNHNKLQALQAAYLVCLYQNWEGTDASKRRIRRHRFSTVVSVRATPQVNMLASLLTIIRLQETLASILRGTWTIACCPGTNSTGVNSS